MNETVADRRDGRILIAALMGLAYWLGAVMLISLGIIIMGGDAAMIPLLAALGLWTLVATVQWHVYRSIR